MNGRDRGQFHGPKHVDVDLSVREVDADNAGSWFDRSKIESMPEGEDCKAGDEFPEGELDIEGAVDGVCRQGMRAVGQSTVWLP